MRDVRQVSDIRNILTVKITADVYHTGRSTLNDCSVKGCAPN